MRTQREDRKGDIEEKKQRTNVEISLKYMRRIKEERL